MPFYLPYEKKVKSTDLIYGLSHIRSLYLLVCDEFMSVINSPQIYIDSYAITMAERFRLAGKSYIEDDDFKEFVALHPKYKSAMTTPYFVAKTYTKPEANYLGEISYTNPISVTKKCKAGLAWAVRNKHNNLSSVTVHFILDGINFQEVIAKSNKNDIEFDTVEEYLAHEAKHTCKDKFFFIPGEKCQLNQKVKSRMITGAELRWVYRNRKNPAVQNTIQFWYRQTPCCPPWHKDYDRISGKPVAHLWKQYQPRSEPITSSRLNIMARFCKSIL